MDALGFILFVLILMLVISLLVRGGKAVSRAVDREQEAKRQPAWESDSAAGSETSGPREVRLGMTPAEVESALGQPETKAELGEKVIYFYKRLTVEFTGAKVSDVR